MPMLPNKLRGVPSMVRYDKHASRYLVIIQLVAIAMAFSS